MRLLDVCWPFTLQITLRRECCDYSVGVKLFIKLNFQRQAVSPTSQESTEECLGSLFHLYKLYTDDNFPEKKINTSTEFQTELLARSRCGCHQLNDVSCLILCRNVNNVFNIVYLGMSPIVRCINRLSTQTFASSEVKK